MTIEQNDDLDGLKRAGRLVRDIREAMVARTRAGVTPLELDALAGRMMAAAGARSAPMLAYSFPGHTCISVAPAVAHGIPDDRPLEDGDLINIDVSAELDGYWADTGISFVVGGKAGAAVGRLLQATRTAQRKAMFAARAGQPINRIGRAVEREAGRHGFTVSPDLNGHGVGRSIHEAPTVWNVYRPRDRQRLHKGLVLAIEPFLTPGSGRIVEDDDGWTLNAADGLPMAQIEHTIVVTDKSPIVLTD